MLLSSRFIDRLEYLKNYLKIDSGRQFAERIGISNGNYMSYKRGTQPALDILVNILSNVEGLNPAWLVRGDLPMFLEKTMDLNCVAEPKEEYHFKNNDLVEMQKKIILMQQDTIASQQRTIENLTMGGKNDIAGGA